MKKVVFGFVLGLLLFIPFSVGAWSKKQMAQPILGFDCPSPEQIEYKARTYTDTYQDGVNSTNFDCSGTVYVFDDAGNKCYVVKGSNASGISCVKGN